MLVCELVGVCFLLFLPFLYQNARSDTHTSNTKTTQQALVPWGLQIERKPKAQERVSRLLSSEQKVPWRAGQKTNPPSSQMNVRKCESTRLGQSWLDQYIECVHSFGCRVRELPGKQGRFSLFFNNLEMMRDQKQFGKTN